jgi:hypothetical protein
MKAVTVSCFGDDPRQVGKDVGAELRASLAGDPDVVLLFCAAES